MELIPLKSFPEEESDAENDGMHSKDKEVRFDLENPTNSTGAEEEGFEKRKSQFNRLANLFSNYRYIQTVNANERPVFRNQSDSKMLQHPSADYSPEFLLQYTRDGNLTAVRRLLSQQARSSSERSKSNSLEKEKESEEIESSSNYNTISGDASTIISKLVKIKLDLETKDEANQTLLIIAIRNGHNEIAELLVDNGANVNALDMDGWTPLLNAAKMGSVSIVSRLLAKKAAIEARDSGGFTPLMWACYKNRLDVVKILIRNEADVNAKCKNSVTCLSWAAGRGYLDIVNELLKTPRIRVNDTDQNGSTALLWAARKGYLAIVKALIEKNANADIPGMNNSTPLILSCKHGHADTALYLIAHTTASLNNVNKDGHNALLLAVKVGQTEVVTSLLNKGAYVTTQNKKGDSILITAVKGGYKSIVDILLDRHVELDVVGSMGKTALHHAVEKGNLEVVQALLANKVDIEIVSKDADTALLIAVKRKFTRIVSELIMHGARVSPTDKNGDNVLHIALRNRSREITEIILTSPKNSKYLYKPNKYGETPYKIDMSNPKSILTQIFGARHLNMTEDNIFGYDLYSSALAEILSEPSLHTPLIVGLYAKWGSGKSFLLATLKSELKSFAKLATIINLKINMFLILLVTMITVVLSLPLAIFHWLYGLIQFFSLFFFAWFFIVCLKYFHQKREKKWAKRISDKLGTQLVLFKLLFQVIFLNPPSIQKEKFEHKNLKFIFTEYGKISAVGSQNVVASMVAALNTKLERTYGVLVTRLCRVFYNRRHVSSHAKFRRVCCVPTFLILLFVVGVSLTATIFFRIKGFKFINFKLQEKILIGTLLSIIGVSLLGSSVTWLKLAYHLIRSPNRRIVKATHEKLKRSGYSNAQSEPKSESFVLQLKHEIDLIAYTVNTIDAFTHYCTRLVIIIDGLDSCEQSKVLQILEMVHVLFSKENDPFISLLAVDPHVLIKGIEGNLTPVFRNGAVNGNDYLRSIIHLPVYLQVDLSKAKAISQTTNSYITKKNANLNLMGSSHDISNI